MSTADTEWPLLPSARPTAGDATAPSWGPRAEAPAPPAALATRGAGTAPQPVTAAASAGQPSDLVPGVPRAGPGEALADHKCLAREAYWRQALRGGGHTLRARRLNCRAQPKGMEVRLVSGEAAPLPHHLRFTSVDQLAACTGGTYESITGAAGRRAARAGQALYALRAPTEDGDALFRVREARGRFAARTPYSKCQRAHRARSPDWTFSRQIFEARTKETVQRQEISEGVEAARR